MLIVSDTTALTTLIKTGMEHVLHALFGRIIIPSKVADELLHHHDVIPSWCEVRAVEPSERLASLSAKVDAGEAEAICLAAELKADAILLDDKKGRREAAALQLPSLALPAVLVQAKRAGLITSLKAAFVLLEQKGSYKLKPAALSELLRGAGEE